MSIIARLSSMIAIPIIGESTSRNFQIVPLPPGWTMNELTIYPPAGWYRITLKVQAGTPHLWVRDTGITYPVDSAGQLVRVQKLATQGVSVSTKDMPTGTEGLLTIEPL